MKRFILPSVVVLLLGLTMLPGTTYTYVVKELNQTMTGVFTFASGATLSSNQRLYIGTPANGNYLVGDDTNQFIKVYNGGVLKATITQNGVIPGACPSDLTGLELGTECFSNGQRVWRDTDGTWKSTTNGKRAMP